jgi:hypothetical protein
MPFAMGEEQDHLEDLFGVKKGKLRSNTKLADHIALYTKRSLSYESDVLNAMRGIFASFARGTRPVWQFWGVPITIPGPFDESRIAKISPQDRGFLSIVNGSNEEEASQAGLGPDGSLP